MGTAPADVAQRQLEAYNAHDLDAFVACYAADIRIFRMPSAAPTLRGIQAFRDHYKKHRFTNASLHAEVLERIVMGNKVVDHERVSGLGEQPIEVLVVYEIEEGLIHRAWFYSG
jgi:hypothetical protein